MKVSKKFADFCRTLTDLQLENVLQDEYIASRTNKKRMADYRAAKMEAERRGWVVKMGERHA